MKKKARLTFSDVLRLLESQEKNAPAQQEKIRNAPELRFPQSTQNRRDPHSGTEKQALRNIEQLHTTPRNNVQAKRAALFDFHKVSREGELNIYECSLPDKFTIRAEKVFNRYGESFRAFYSASPRNADPDRASLIGYGNNYTDSIAHLLGIHQFRNPHSVRWLNFFELCIPHIHIPGNKNMLPRNPGKIPTQSWVDSLNNISANLGKTKEVQLRHTWTLSFAQDHVDEELATAAHDLHDALEKSNKHPFENPLTAVLTQGELQKKFKRYKDYGVLS